MSVPRIGGPCIAYQSWTDNVRAHADMNTLLPLCPFATSKTHGNQHAGLWKFTSRASTVAKFKTLISIVLQDFRYVSNVASSKRLQYVWAAFPTHCLLHAVLPSYGLRRNLPWRGLPCLLPCESASRCAFRIRLWQFERNNRHFLPYHNGLRKNFCFRKKGVMFLLLPSG